jgi:hypothetical protein
MTLEGPFANSIQLISTPQATVHSLVAPSTEPNTMLSTYRPYSSLARKREKEVKKKRRMSQK